MATVTISIKLEDGGASAEYVRTVDGDHDWEHRRGVRDAITVGMSVIFPPYAPDPE